MSRQIKHLWAVQVAADILAVFSAYYTTFLVRLHSSWGETFFSRLNRALGVQRPGELGEEVAYFYAQSGPRIIAIICITICVLYALRDLYAGKRFICKRPVVWDILVANFIALVLFYVYFYMSRNIWHPRSFFATAICLNAFLCVTFRGLANMGLAALRDRFDLDKCHAVLLGSGSEADYIRALTSELHPHGIDIIKELHFDLETPFDELIRTVKSLAQKKDIDMLICAERRLSVAQIMLILELTGELDITTKILSDKLEVLTNRAHLAVDLIHGVPLVHFEAPSVADRSVMTRRAIATVFAYAGIILTLPILALCALMVRLSGRGPVLFVQERMGVNRKPFRMWKFRTMYHRADEQQAQVEEFNESGLGLFKIRRDPRVTPIGRLLRRFSLDELPQLLNVLRGDMTIVGPRPLPRRDFENYYEDWHYSRHAGMPGLTCLWQVSGRSDIDFHNMCILDLFYLRNQSWVLDLKIILKTFWVVLFAKGAY